MHKAMLKGMQFLINADLYALMNLYLPPTITTAIKSFMFTECSWNAQSFIRYSVLYYFGFFKGL